MTRRVYLIAPFRSLMHCIAVIFDPVPSHIGEISSEWFIGAVASSRRRRGNGPKPTRGSMSAAHNQIR